LNAATHSLSSIPIASLAVPVQVVLLLVGATFVAAGLVATAELTLRIARQRSTQPGFPVLNALYAQKLYAQALYAFAPAVAAGAVTLIHTQRLADVVYLLAVMIPVSLVLRADDHALHLMPLARIGFNVFVVAAGVGLALVPSAFGHGLLDSGTALAALVAGGLVTVLAGPLQSRFEAGAPIRLAVIGPSTFADKLAAELADSDIRGYTVAGFLDEGADPDGQVEWLGRLDDVRQIVQDSAVDLLVVAPAKQRLTVFEQTAKACLDLPVRMIEATALYENVLGHVPIGTINSAWFQFIMHPRYSPSSPLSKRVLDLVVSGLVLTAALPLMLVCSIAIKLEDRGPVFYRQQRVGEEGREFSMLKFRTLRPDADDLADQLPEDELVTRMGALLRRTHLNELPQLVQVLRGEMSLVGPRPEPPALVRELSGLVPYYERRALVKPGLTGWAQVRCGYAGTRFGTAWKMCHDLYYIKHRSARFDLLILLQTLHVLVEREGEEQMPAPSFVLGDSLDLDGSEQLVGP
jgi:exopolysaccharide biosynthesis polyprenyl glycosylphosphotransferase